MSCASRRCLPWCILVTLIWIHGLCSFSHHPLILFLPFLINIFASNSIFFHNLILFLLLQKWWCWLVEQFPLYVAPNLITITGLVINIVTSLLLVYYSPYADREVCAVKEDWYFCITHSCCSIQKWVGQYSCMSCNVTIAYLLSDWMLHAFFMWQITADIAVAEATSTQNIATNHLMKYNVNIPFYILNKYPLSIFCE